MHIVRQPVKGNGTVPSDRLQSCPCDKGIFNRHNSADAAACAGVKLDKFQLGNVSVFDCVKHLVDIFDSVCRQIVVVENRRRFAAAGGPAYAYHARL